MIEYSARAVRGLAYLFKQYNDVEVYVEDQTCKGMYEVLLGRILGEEAKISRVFQLKGKQNVIDACKADQIDTKRRRIYIIDGDFDSVVGNNIEPDLNYFYQFAKDTNPNQIEKDEYYFQNTDAYVNIKEFENNIKLMIAYQKKQ